MVKKLLAVFNREIAGVHQAAFLLGLASIAAKILAILRDRLLAGLFGAGQSLDIYFAAFRIPDFLYTASLLLVASAAVMPLLIQKERAGSEPARRFISELISVFALIMILSATIAFLFMPFLARLIAPGFSQDNFSQMVALSRILLLSPILLGLSALISSVIQAHRRFFIYAVSPVLYNAGIIFGILFFYPIIGFSGLVWGVVLGALAHILIQLPSLHSLGYWPKPALRVNFRDILNVFYLSLPRSIGLEINQIILIVITAMASALSAGSIAVFQLSYNLYSIPLGVIGLSYSLAAFPALARSFADGKTGEFEVNVNSSIRHIIFWSTPAAILFIVLRAHIVRVVLGAGAFGWADTRLTAAALGIFSVAIVAQSVSILLVRAFYAAGRVAFPLLVDVFTAGVIIGFSYGFLKLFEISRSFQLFFNAFLRVEDLSQTSVLILVFAFSLGSVLDVFLLWLGFVRIFRFSDGKLRKSAFKNALAGAALGASTYGLLRLTGVWFDLKTFGSVFFHGFLAGTGGIAAAAAVHWFLRNEELFEILDALRRKFWSRPVIASEPQSASQG
ncbi:MAG: lipid II flippase MurJ [Patescibacteria group bacterium]